MGPGQPPEEISKDNSQGLGSRFSLPRTGAVPLTTLVGYAKEVLSELARNRDVRSDDSGRPIYRELSNHGSTTECTWQVFEVDFSGIGMATDMPLIAQAYSDADDIEWNFGPTPIRSTPRLASPREAASLLDMNILLDGFRRFVRAESVLFPTALTRDVGKEKGPVSIDPADCTCSECGESLEITDVDESTMSVECLNGHEYQLEHDAFEAGFDYVLDFLSRRGRGE